MDLPITLSRCPVSIKIKLEPSRGIPVVPKTHEGELTDKQIVDYKEQRTQFLSWLLKEGKAPEKAEGYSPYTVSNTAYRTAQFDRWMWDQKNRYHYPPESDDAAAYMDWLAVADKTQTDKGKKQEALKRCSKWLHHEHGRDEWNFEYSFDGSGGNHQPQDFLTREERRVIRQVALNEGSLPAYSTLTAEERSGWKHYVANVLGKDYTDVTEEDWDEVNGWEITSLVWTSLDVGFRPAEVGNATTEWVDATNGVLRIPKAESSKNEGNWTVSVTDRTATALSRWLEERELYDRYEETDTLWLTSHGNPWGSKSLRRLLHRLCDYAGIETANRKMSWYTIRHSVGTYMTKERDLAAAKAQLRHKNPVTTMKYDQVPVEDRRDALDRMG
ncbi:tyrosine-type recombinase/integrase [Halorussus salinisoli]|uniref:tyrosine-type recombinase/integrase n=1 Tax=Halorussus salinisoli TaxID=2558242 RepID=UPI002A90887C|nr:site-specific integrase [Halorussus salinisoli]